MGEQDSPRWSIHTQSEKADFEKSDKTEPVRFLFTPVDKAAKLGLNKYYSAQLLSCSHIAYFLDMPLKEVKEELQKHNIFPSFYRKRSALYSVKDVIKLAKKLTISMTDKLGCDGFNIIQNNKEVAGQTVFHFHMHLIPRYKDGKSILTWGHEEFTPEEMEDICKSLR